MARTLLIVDDHAEFRASARALLEAEGYDVIGEAPDGTTAIMEARRLHPDLVLLDVNLPDLDGFQVAERITAHNGAPAVVLVSSRERSAYGGRLDDAPVRGFLAKRQLSGSALAVLVG